MKHDGQLDSEQGYFREEMSDEALFPSTSWSDLMPFGLLVFHFESQVFFLNKQCAELLQLEHPTSLSLKTLLDRMGEEDRYQLLQKLESSFYLQQGSKCQLSIEVNGKYRLFELKTSGVNRNEAYLKASLELLKPEVHPSALPPEEQQILNAIHDSVIVIDAQGLITYWNPGAERLYGKTASEVVGKPITFINPEFVLNNYYEMYLRGESYVRKNWSFHKDDELHTVDVLAAPLLNEEGEFRGVLGVSRDVTSLLSDLEQQVEQKELAERTSKLKTEFLNNMSHEIRTPLNGILGTLELLSDWEHHPDVAELLEMQRKSAQRLMQTLNGILSMSKVEAKSGLIKVEKVILKEVLEALMENFHSLALKKGLKLSFDLPHPDVKLLAHPGSLIQVLNNLVQNSLKFTEEGSIFIRVVEGEEQIVIRVEDTGAGVDPTFVPQLFTPFSQEENEKQKGLDGSGLGLSLVRKYVSLMGGTVSFEPNKPRGACFVVKLSKAW